MSEHHHSKKEKKLAQLFKNRRTQSMHAAAETAQRQRDLDAEREEERDRAALASSRAAASKKKDAEPAWSARMQMIRDRNTGQHRMAQERWNRFAGTETGGGRGL